LCPIRFRYGAEEDHHVREGRRAAAVHLTEERHLRVVELEPFEHERGHEPRARQPGDGRAVVAEGVEEDDGDADGRHHEDGQHARGVGEKEVVHQGVISEACDARGSRGTDRR